MNDHEWQQAYNAGRREAEGLERALSDLLEALDMGIMENSLNYIKKNNAARTALAKYREKK